MGSPAFMWARVPPGMCDSVLICEARVPNMQGEQLLPVLCVLRSLSFSRGRQAASLLL
jgi:hypothetical protein